VRLTLTALTWVDGFLYADTHESMLKYAATISAGITSARTILSMVLNAVAAGCGMIGGHASGEAQSLPSQPDNEIDGSAECISSSGMKKPLLQIAVTFQRETYLVVIPKQICRIRRHEELGDAVVDAVHRESPGLQDRSCMQHKHTGHRCWQVVESRACASP
jgi:hypothetical protein